MKKILFLSPLPPPHYGSSMSSEMCLKILENSKEFETKNIKLNYSKKMSDIGKLNLNKIKGIFHVIKKIKKILKTFKPDLVYFVPATGGLGFRRDYWFFKILKKNYSGKIILHIRSRIDKKDALKYKKFYEKIFYNKKVIILGKELILDIKNFVKAENIIILPNAIENFISEREFFNIQKQRKQNKISRILFLSNMDKTKGWPKILEACKILHSENVNFSCNFVGAWQNEKDMVFFNNFVQKNNLSKKIFYLGKRNNKEKEEILRNSDILVFPTEYKFETFGRVILEGMCVGIPVIANGVVAIPSIISDGKTGFILKKNSPEEISEYIKKLIENKKLRIKMGFNGRKKFLKQFELKKYRRDFVNLINSV